MSNSPTDRRPLLGFVLFVVGGCSSSLPHPPPPDDGFDRAAMLASQGEAVILPAYRDFLTAARSLQTATATHAAARTTESLAAARTAWQETMRRWQRAELFSIGPAGLSTTMRG